MLTFKSGFAADAIEQIFRHAGDKNSLLILWDMGKCRYLSPEGWAVSNGAPRQSAGLIAGKRERCATSGSLLGWLVLGWLRGCVATYRSTLA